MFNLDDYEPVDVRISKWWEKHPEGSIQTELIRETHNGYIMRATLYTADGLIVATGHASEIITDRGVNATSALENCETSAIGRALASAGFQAKIGKRPSREEMAKVQRAEEAKPDVWESSPSPHMSTMGEALDILSRELGAEGIPTCKHGARERKEGVSSKTGKPYSGWVCSSKNRKDQCEAMWN